MLWDIFLVLQVRCSPYYNLKIDHAFFCGWPSFFLVQSRQNFASESLIDSSLLGCFRKLRILSIHYMIVLDNSKNVVPSTITPG